MGWGWRPLRVPIQGRPNALRGFSMGRIRRWVGLWLWAIGPTYNENGPRGVGLNTSRLTRARGRDLATESRNLPLN